MQKEKRPVHSRETGDVTGRSGLRTIRKDQRGVFAGLEIDALLAHLTCDTSEEFRELGYPLLSQEPDLELAVLSVVLPTGLVSPVAEDIARGGRVTPIGG